MLRKYNEIIFNMDNIVKGSKYDDDYDDLYDILDNVYTFYDVSLKNNDINNIYTIDCINNIEAEKVENYINYLL